MIAPATPEQAIEIAALIERGFSAFVATDTTERGQDVFRAVASAESISRRIAAGGLGLTAITDGRLVGYLEMTHRDHIILLFVEPDLHRQGIGRQLIDAAKPYRRGTTLTVNAARSAIDAYEALGFAALGSIETKDGITFLPMALPVLS